MVSESGYGADESGDSSRSARIQSIASSSACRDAWSSHQLGTGQINHKNTRILQLSRAIASTSDDSTITNKDTAHRHFLRSQSLFCLIDWYSSRTSRELGTISRAFPIQWVWSRVDIVRKEAKQRVNSDAHDCQGRASPLPSLRPDAQRSRPETSERTADCPTRSIGRGDGVR